MPNKLTIQEQRLLQHILQSNEQVRRIYEEAIEEITVTASTYKYKGKVFNLDDYPLLKKKINAKIAKMHASIYTVIVNSIKASWNMANQNNDVLVDRRLAGRTPTGQEAQILYDTNLPALNEYIRRKDNGLNLSRRIWNSLKPFPMELEQGLYLGIREGRSANKMATALKQYLSEPNNLFRRVRDDKGNLVLSKRAKAYKPGQGKYRSSYKNALRLTATETNMVYRSADFERWQQLDFIVGFVVKLSNSHPTFDICDHLEGEYPNDFKFIGWHPRCLCYSIPILDKRARDPESKRRQPVTVLPSKALNYIESNAKRIKGWKNEPYWRRDNGKYLSKLFE